MNEIFKNSLFINSTNVYGGSTYSIFSAGNNVVSHTDQISDFMGLISL